MPSQSQFAFVPSVALALALVGCAVSDPIELPVAASGGASGSVGSGTGGVTATGRVTGTGGATDTGGGAGTGGTTGTGGESGTGGVTGTGSAATGSGGVPGTGRGGASGTGGRPGASGGAGTSDTGGAIKSDGGLGTFAAVYADVISKYCFGSNCHNPGGGNRPSFSSQMGCYSYFKNQGQLYPSQDPTKSYIYFIMSGDPTASPPSPPYMPPTPNAKVSASDLAIVAAWIADGALND